MVYEADHSPLKTESSESATPDGVADSDHSPPKTESSESATPDGVISATSAAQRQWGRVAERGEQMIVLIRSGVT